MEINKIINVIENFAPLELQENWDCSGFQIYADIKDVRKVLLCLSLTEDIINQAIERNCDLIISHHPLFYIPFKFNIGVPVYSAHTNLDKADGGTTDTLIKELGLNKAQKIGDFLRLVELEEEISLDNFIKLTKAKLNIKSIRVINNLNRQSIKRIAFCAGSGMDLLDLVRQIGADVFVTGDVKYHQALDSNVIIIDAGHFETERPVLTKIKELLDPMNIEVVVADEKSPFIMY